MEVGFDHFNFKFLLRQVKVCAGNGNNELQVGKNKSGHASSIQGLRCLEEG